MMDSMRVREILESKGVIEVRHKGAAVWIEGLEGGRATVRYLDSDRRSQVPVRELEESG